MRENKEDGIKNLLTILSSNSAKIAIENMQIISKSVPNEGLFLLPEIQI